MDTTKAISKAQRDKIDSSDFAQPPDKYPCDTRAHARSAIRLYGHADNPAKVKAAIIRILKRKGWTDLIPAAWGATKDMDMPDLIVMGGSVKALGAGKVGGHLVLYGDATTPDLSGYKDYFTAATEYDIEPGERRGMYWAHGQDPKLGVKKIGTLTITPDEHGLWVEGVLDMADKYQQSIYEMAEKGKLGWSSGAPSHLVARKAVEVKGVTVHEITHWPIAEGSLTPTPADYRNRTCTIKSLHESFAPTAENHTTKALPSGMSYDDLRAFLSDELNEDFPDTDDDGTDPWGPGLHVRDVYDDALVYADEEDLYRIPYKVTPGNDVVWGTPESVVRTTVYVTATDGDDDAEDADNNAVPITGMAGKQAQADVTALKAMLRDSMTFSDHADVATSAMEGFVARAESLTDMSIKAGRVISGANRDKLKRIHAGMTTAHTAMAGHLEAINDMLLSTDPDAKKDVDEIAALRMQSLRLQSRALGIPA
jgi:phage head maturation protease